MPSTIRYAKGSYKVYRQDGRYVIKDGPYTVTGFPEPHTLDEAKTLVDELARCTTCHGEQITTCRTCQGEQRIYKYVTVANSSYRNTPTSIPCPDCVGRGWVQCPRCKGSGIKPS